jgi:hypothetical protein
VSEPDGENGSAGLFRHVASSGSAAALAWAVGHWGTNVPAALVVVAALFFAGATYVVHTMYRRYAAILARNTPHARRDYAALRRTLATEGLAGRAYERWLTAALAAVDRFFGDAEDGAAHGSLWPQAFGLRVPAPLWTPASFDRCLLLALLYPLATIVLFWLISGHVGEAERALGLAKGLTGWRRLGLSAGITFALLCLRQGLVGHGWSHVVLLIAGYAALITLMIASSRAGAGAGVAFILVGVGVGAVARADALTRAIAVDIGGALAVVIALSSLVAAACSAAGAVSVVGAFSVAVVVTGAFSVIGMLSRARGWRGRFQVALVLFLGIACGMAGNRLASDAFWMFFGPLLLLFGPLTLINAPFDWASLGLTRALLRRGLERGGWWPALLGMADAAIAGVIIIALTIVTVIGVQAFDDLAAFTGGGQARVLPLKTLFDGIELDPWATEYWWVYAMLLSTMLPSMANLMIGSASLLRGVKWLRLRLLSRMPVHGAPAPYDRRWIAALLTVQVFAGWVLGIVTQLFIAYGVVVVILPVFGLDLLDLARVVEEPDLPRQLFALLGVPGAH